ncbi:hypothetical protein BKE38_14985 [Pseudoroseomonas deserti]|uniref:Uncharacterized protein n=1 Tax=Teichococcus deserti TaxID=1817963 RepID=A0A1V2H177_9PROT|nr:hypothetical protein [Pseudoroseomonas deserti]ONG52115.1 hypothetical protein BKE38_14985 [Pseudoroseomonas deserti]
MGSFALRCLVMLCATILGLVLTHLLAGNLDWVNRAGGLQRALERALVVLAAVVSLCWLAGLFLASRLPPAAHRKRDSILAGLLALLLTGGLLGLRVLGL